ncbi:MAG: hypothetical protein ABEI86_01715 [Halobacteriaceae archaeon]
MALPYLDVLEKYQKPEYTGENRCIPCTIVNIVLAVIFAGVIAGVVSIYFSYVWGFLLGGVIFFLSGSLIYFRGYLIPGTPWITKTYFPDAILRWFDKTTETREDSTSGHQDIEQILQESGAVMECEDVDDLCLRDEFQSAWRNEIEKLQEEDTARDELATVLNVAASELRFEDHGDAFVAYLDDQHIGQWESHAAFFADVGAARVLRNQFDRWSTLSVQDKSKVLNGLRIFLEQCPVCNGLVTVDQEVVESCCRSIDVVAVTCQDCNARLFEAEQPGAI